MSLDQIRRRRSSVPDEPSITCSTDKSIQEKKLDLEQDTRQWLAKIPGRNISKSVDGNELGIIKIGKAGLPKVPGQSDYKGQLSVTSSPMRQRSGSHGNICKLTDLFHSNTNSPKSKLEIDFQGNKSPLIGSRVEENHIGSTTPLQYHSIGFQNSTVTAPNRLPNEYLHKTEMSLDSFGIKTSSQNYSASPNLRIHSVDKSPIISGLQTKPTPPLHNNRSSLFSDNFASSPFQSGRSTPLESDSSNLLERNHTPSRDMVMGSDHASTVLLSTPNSHLLSGKRNPSITSISTFTANLHHKNISINSVPVSSSTPLVNKSSVSVLSKFSVSPEQTSSIYDCDSEDVEKLRNDLMKCRKYTASLNTQETENALSMEEREHEHFMQTFAPK